MKFLIGGALVFVITGSLARYELITSTDALYGFGSAAILFLTWIVCWFFKKADEILERI